jgi:ribosome maturation factor RimP
MQIAHEKLHGLDRTRVLAAVVPVLSAHQVDVVELVWRTDRGGWVLEITLERPGSRVPGEGITLDLCSDISRELSAALDVDDTIPQRYRLEVGSPGVERALYGNGDYARFAGRSARIKLKEAREGQYVLYGVLQGVEGEGRIVLELDRGERIELSLEVIESARLVFEPAARHPERDKAARAGRSGPGSKARRPQRTSR